MYHACHNLPNETVVKQLNESLFNDPQFETWTTESIYHLYYAALGENGEEAKILSLQLLKNFNKWYKTTMEDNYLPKYDMERMYLYDDLVQTLRWLKKYQPSPETTIKERLKEFEQHKPSNCSILLSLCRVIKENFGIFILSFAASFLASIL